MSEANKDLVRRHFDQIFNRKDLDACDELMAEAFVENAVAPFGTSAPGAVNGPVAMRATAEWLIAQFPDIHMEIEAIVAEGDLVACRILTEGTNLGPFNEMIPATGKRFSARQSHWFRVADGKLAEHWATREDLPAMIQLGIVRPRRTTAPLGQGLVQPPHQQPFVRRIDLLGSLLDRRVSAPGQDLDRDRRR